MTLPVLDAALSYAARGWRVIPLRGKVPLCEHGSRDGTTDVARICAWFASWPSANVGVCTGPESSLWVLDADGVEGRKTLEALDLTTDTPWVVTGGGGLHVYFAWDERVRQCARFRPGLDTRARGGYVVAPPSVHECGRKYAWVIDPPPPPIRAGESIIEAVSKRKPVERMGSLVPKRAPCHKGISSYGQRALDGTYVGLAQTEQGGRDDARNAAAWSLGRLAAGGHLPQEDAVLCVVSACEANGLAADLGDSELRKRVERAVREGFEAGPRGPERTAG